MSRARWCQRCRGILRCEITHDAVRPAHADANYIEIRWVCRDCGHVGGPEMGRLP